MIFRSAANGFPASCLLFSGAAQNAFNCVRPHVEQAAAGAWNWMEHSAYELGGALDKLFSAFHMDPNGET